MIKTGTDFKRTYNGMKDAYTADFETTGEENLRIDGRVAVMCWSLVNIKDSSIHYWGTTIDSFYDKLIEIKARKVWFHNLNFDGHFIIWDLMNRGALPPEKQEFMMPNGRFMTITYTFDTDDGGHTVEFWDSLTKYTMSVDAVSIYLGIERKKDPGLRLWDEYWNVGDIPPKEFIEYNIHDSYIMAEAMKLKYLDNRYGRTASADAFSSFRMSVRGGNKLMTSRTDDVFKNTFPTLTIEMDSKIRKSYRGGICQVNPIHTNQVLENIYVVDEKSAYPFAMSSNDLPFGYPIEVDEKPCDEYLYTVSFDASFELKKGKLPTLQERNSGKFGQPEFIRFSDEPMELNMTSVEYEGFKRRYNVHDEYNHEYIALQKKSPEEHYFKPFIEEKISKRNSAKAVGNKYDDLTAKNDMNMVYGSMALNPHFNESTVRMKPNGQLDFSHNETIGEGRYIPVACFITAYAREYLASSIEKQGIDNFVYCDTDSMHLLCEPKDITIGHELGNWEVETWNDCGKPYPRGKYLRAKTYALANEYEIIYHKKDKYGNLESELKCAGMQDDVKETIIHLDDFQLGKNYGERLRATRVPGGILLKKINYTLKEL